MNDCKRWSSSSACAVTPLSSSSKYFRRILQAQLLVVVRRELPLIQRLQRELARDAASPRGAVGPA
jgi:hypothetical protein